MQKTAYAHWVNWIIRKAHSRQRSCQSCSWEQSRRAAAPRSSAARWMIVPVLTHAEARFKCTETFFHYPNLYLDWSHVCVFISSSTLIRPSVFSSRALTSTHSAWHRAMWLGAPWPALMHRRGCKWRRSEIDRGKDSPVKVKGKQTFSFPRLQPLVLTPPLQSLWNLHDASERPQEPLWLWNHPWKIHQLPSFLLLELRDRMKTHPHAYSFANSAPGLKGKEARK